jgi:non-heme chloroperoxidase
MPFIKVGHENDQEIKIHFSDQGQGDVVVCIHGYPFSGSAWEKQLVPLLQAGYRVITYDRRGFGLSSHPSKGYDYDTFATDLNMLLAELNLQNVTLVGHSMGTGEVARYLGKYGSERIRAAVFIAPIPPFLLKTSDNQTGVDETVFEGLKDAIRNDRYAFMSDFLKNFYNTDKQSSFLVSEEKLRADFNLGTSSSPIAFYECVDTWITDFRKDLPSINVPSLIIQGDEDQILPLEATGKILAKKIKARLKVIEGGSHGIPWTHGEEIAKEILDFMKETATHIPKGQTIASESTRSTH